MGTERREKAFKHLHKECETACLPSYQMRPAAYKVLTSLTTYFSRFSTVFSFSVPCKDIVGKLHLFKTDNYKMHVLLLNSRNKKTSYSFNKFDDEIGIYKEGRCSVAFTFA